MNKIVRNIIAILAGVIGGSIVNMGIISVSGSIIPPPEGADVTTTEGLKASMHLFEAKHFIMPFIAHALGTFVGAAVTAALAANHRMKFALAVGIFFMLGGIASIFMLPSPLWYNIFDLALAYIPAAYLGARIVIKSKKELS